MRLSRSGDEYEFDARFYILVVCGIAILAFAFWYGKQLIDRSQGRQIQELITTANLDSRDAYKRHAKNYVAGLARQHALDAAQRAKAEDIFTEAFYQRMRIWTQDRVDGVAISETRRKQQELWVRTMRQFEDYVKSLGK